VSSTILDTFVTLFILDPAGFSKGRKQVEDDSAKLKSGAASTAKELEARGKQAGRFFSEVRNQVIGLFAAITGGKALEQFIADTVATDAATGRLAHNLDMTTEELSAWQGMAERAGGSAQGIAGSFQNLTSEFQKFQLTGESSVIPYFRALGVQISDAEGRARPLSDILLDLADRFHNMDPRRAQAMGAGLGLDQGTINVLMQGRAAVQAMLAEQRRIGVITGEDATRAQQLTSAWRGMVQASAAVGRTLLTELLPAITWVANRLTVFAEWARSHLPMVRAFFIGLAAAAIGFAVALLAPLAELLLVSAGIGAVVAAIAILYDDWKTWTEGGKAAFGGFWQFVEDKWNSLLPMVRPIWAELKTIAADWFAAVRDYLKFVYTLFFGTSDQIRAAWKTLFGDLKRLFGDFIDFIAQLGPMVLKAMKSAFEEALSWVEHRLGAIWNAISGTHNAPEDSSANADDQDDFAHRLYHGLENVDLSKLGADQPTSTLDQSAAASLFAGLENQYQLPKGLLDTDWAEESGRGKAMLSSAGAEGHFQFMPDTAKQYGVSNPYDLEQSATGAAKMFHDMLQKYNGDLRKALAAFDWGPGNVDKDIAKWGDQWDQHLPTEAANYIRKITGAMSARSGTAMSGAPAGSSSTVNARVEKVEVHTQATDAKGIARDIGPALEDYTFATTANGGVF